jgi:hypothetical protein
MEKNQENAVFYVSWRKLKHFRRLKIYWGLRIICKIGRETSQLRDV